MRWCKLLWNEHGDFGGRQDREKEAKEQESFARSQEERQSIKNQFLSQLVPGSAEYNELQAILIGPGSGPTHGEINQLGSELVQRQQARIAAGEPATALETRTGLAFQGLRDVAAFSPEEQALLNALRGIVGTGEPGQAGGVEDIFSQLVGRARDPDAAFKSTFDQQFQLAEEANRAAFANRGLLRSGLEQEGATRAGNELAIREAAAREDFRQRQLENFQNLFNAGQTLRGREIGVEEALVNMMLGRESNLTSLLATQTGNATQNLLDLLGTQTGRAERLRDLASGLREAERQSREKFVGDLLLPSVTVGIPGVASVTTPSGGSAFPQTSPASPGALQVATQTGQTGGGTQPSQASTLSRRRTQDDDALAQLVVALSGAS